MKKSYSLSLNDEELVRLFVATQKQPYFEELYRRYFTKVYRHCLQIVKDPDLAQDYTHDIFVLVIIKIDHFRGRSSFATWLYALTRNFCITKIRNSKSISYIPLEDAEYIADDYADTQEQKLTILQEALALLTTEESDLLLMKYTEDLELTQIGEQLTLTIGAVKMRLKRSREKLRRHIVLQSRN